MREKMWTVGQVICGELCARQKPRWSGTNQQVSAGIDGLTRGIDDKANGNWR